MGRPLNKRNFGPPTDQGAEIKVQFYNGTSSVNGWIVRQTGSKRFECSDGTDTRICYLVDTAAASLVAGEMSITVKDDGGTPRRITKIAAHKTTASDGNSYGWTFDDSTSDGYVEMEEAGGVTGIVVTGSSGTGTEVTIETAGHTFVIGDEITVAGMTPVGYDGDYTVTGVTSTDILFAHTEAGVFSAGGTIAIFEDTFGI